MRVCPKCLQEYDLEEICPVDGERLNEITIGSHPNDQLVGQLLAGRYLILSKVGEGGMGSVYKARQQSVDRLVAIKILHGALAYDESAVKRFHQEAKAASRLKNPNSITVYDFGQTENGILYIAMEFLFGEPLGDYISRIGLLSVQKTIDILLQICSSLEEAHNVGIIHRDLKPDNIFLTEMSGKADFVKVLDFGVAKLKESKGDGTLTQAGMIFGTPKYMSPEQAHGKNLDTRSDIYSLGAIMYEMLCGHTPFDAPTPLGILLKHIGEPVSWDDLVKLQVPTYFLCVIQKLLEKNSDNRYQTVKALADDLIEFRDTGEIAAFKERVGTNSTGGINEFNPGSAVITLGADNITKRSSSSDSGADGFVERIPTGTVAVSEEAEYPKRRRKKSAVLYLIPILLIIITAGAYGVYVTQFQEPVEGNIGFVSKDIALTSLSENLFNMEVKKAGEDTEKKDPEVIDEKDKTDLHKAKVIPLNTQWKTQIDKKQSKKVEIKKKDDDPDFKKVDELKKLE